MHSWQLGYLSLGAPLVGALIAYVLAFRKRTTGHQLCIYSIALSLIANVVLLYKVCRTGTDYIILNSWIKAEALNISWGFLFDPLSTLMMLLVSTISLLVHIYSAGYMQHDPGKLRFFGHLNLFTFMMLLLVCAPNLLQLFCGWEGVGLASYLLISHWHGKTSAINASIKAFVINRIGDIGLVLAIGAIFAIYKTLAFKELFVLLNTSNSLLSSFWLNTIGLLLLLGAMGKSGQFGLHTWLPDAMEAPTPVSALLHAATMVTAGVFLILRFSPLFEHAPIAKHVMMLVGLLTGIFASTTAICQTDIKKIIAYSTCSQLGLMFMACAAGAYTVAFFHLFTHAFFKALLFLGAGAVIHAMSNEQNILRMGGLKSHLPSSYYLMLIGTLALCGFPLFAGYYSKDLIFAALYQSTAPMAKTYYAFAQVITLCTGLYSWRLLFLVFHGKSNADEQVTAHIHLIPKTMQHPINVLALCSIVMGYLGFKLVIDQSFGFAWDNSVVQNIQAHVPATIEYLPLLCSGLALAICYHVYLRKPSTALKIAKKFPFTYEFLKNKWYFDTVYKKRISAPSIILGRVLYKSWDRGIIDRFGPDGLAKLAFQLGKQLQKLQTGYLFHYCLMVVLGIVVIISGYLSMQLFPGFTKSLKLLMGRL